MNYSILNFINFLLKEKFVKEYKKKSEKIVYLHLKEVDFLPKTVFYFIFRLIEILSQILYIKKFVKLNIFQKRKVFKVSKFFLNSIINKIEELIYALYLIHINNNEKLNMKKNFYKKKSFYKHIVIGSGPGGSITGYFLQKNLGNVLMVEEGEEFSLPKTKHPGDEFVKKWRNGGITTSIFPNQINFSSGKCLGGGSEINSGLYHFPGKDFINGSKKLFNIKDFNYNSLKKHNKLILDISKTSKSKNSVSENRFLKAAKKNNFKVEKIPSLFWKSTKSSMLNTFIKKYKLNNGQIKTNTKVNKIKKINNQWMVETVNGENKKEFLFCTNIFLCCGSIETQKILYRSKLFDSKILNFKLHPMIKVLCRFDRKIQKKNQNVHSSQITSYMPNFIIGEAASSKQFQLINFINEKKLYKTIKKKWENISIIHSTFSFGGGKIFKIPFLDKYLYLYNIKNKNLKYVKKSLKIICKAMFSSGAKEIYLPFKNNFVLTNNNYNKLIDTINNINKVNFSAVHILGGVRFGESQICEADSFGKIKNYSNLYVNDSSLINFPLLKNPQGTVMIIAYRNILNFLKNIKKRN